MAKIKPFKAVVYNREKVKDFSKVVCPPYDIISPARQQHYHNLSPHNLIHILLGKDIPGEDKYHRSARLFKEWLREGILIQEDAEAIYFYAQQYRIRGEKKTRLGFIGRLFLEEKKSTFGHEHTHLAPKEDRFRLLKVVKANLSPIFVIFSDKKRIIQSIYERHIRESGPFIDITDDEGINHKVWRLSDPEVIRTIEKGMKDENIFIADGHHRYEVACAYRDKMRQRLGAGPQEQAFDYVLAYFTNTDTRGLTILPIHRFVRLTPDFSFEGFVASLRGNFITEEVKNKTRFFFLMEKGGRTEHVLGMYYDKKFWLLRLRNIKVLDKAMADNPPEFRNLDVSILNHLIFTGALGLDLQDNARFSFSPDVDELIRKADSEQASISFFLNPVRMQQIMALALKGNKMPPKSTYFYPKVLSGLVINRHGDS